MRQFIGENAAINSPFAEPTCQSRFDDVGIFGKIPENRRNRP